MTYSITSFLVVLVLIWFNFVLYGTREIFAALFKANQVILFVVNRQLQSRLPLWQVPDC
uniref:Non-structural protein 3a n=1 Tax=Bird gammacoronavirus AnasCN24 TaxID=3237959 RepID=A0AB39AFA0_9GAMC